MGPLHDRTEGVRPGLTAPSGLDPDHVEPARGCQTGTLPNREEPRMIPVPPLSRAYASVSLPDGHVASVEHVGRTHEPRNVWRWRIYVPDRPVMAGDDLTTAMDVSDPDPLAALSTLGAFLGDYADTRHLDSDALFLGLSQSAARALSDEISLNIPDADADGLDDPMLTVHATEVDQDGRGPNEWLVEVTSDPSDVEPRALLCSTSNPYPLLATMRAHGVTVVEHRYEEESA